LSRPGHLSNRGLVAATAAAALIVLAWALARDNLPESLRSPGSVELQLVGLLGAGLLLVPTVFAIVKRSGHGTSAAFWVSVHAISALAGTVLIVIHSAGHFDEPPALMLAALLGLMGLGIWARTDGALRMANTFGTKAAAFSGAGKVDRDALRDLLQAKRALLAQLEPAACEATFSPNLVHWLKRPRLTCSYASLVRQEAQRVGQRASVASRLAWWRPLHLALALLFVAGLAIHLITVTFFAGWVAEGRPITWWHLTAW